MDRYARSAAFTMRLASVEVFKVNLPFRFAFGHSLATRASSQNLIVKVELDDGTQGFGEGIPRDYVTGEDIDSAYETVKSTYAPRVAGMDASSLDEVVLFLEQQFESLGLHSKPRGAGWCALELAILDAVAKAHGLGVAEWMGPPVQEVVRYGAVVPMTGQKSLLPLLYFYKLYGFATVKIKVGGDLEDDTARVRLARKIMGPQAILRIDANCAWTADKAIRACEKFRPYKIVSVEQPVTAGDIAGLAEVTSAVPERVVADESLCTLGQARELAERRACNAFNIRISKVGGLLAAQKMLQIAGRYGIECHLGAQVGESGILSAAGRIFACINQPLANYEGSDNKFLLKQDLTREDLTVGWKGLGKLLPGLGLGVSINSQDLSKPTFISSPPAGLSV